MANDAGKRLIILPDTMEALEHESGRFAALSLDLRLALYEQASNNLVGLNGPCALLRLSGAPFAQFGFVSADDEKHWVEHLKMKRGDQLPWATAAQVITWDPWNIEGMREAVGL